jgi:hypothetical protein
MLGVKAKHKGGSSTWTHVVVWVDTKSYGLDGTQPGSRPLHRFTVTHWDAFPYMCMARDEKTGQHTFGVAASEHGRDLPESAAYVQPSQLPFARALDSWPSRLLHRDRKCNPEFEGCIELYLEVVLPLILDHAEFLGAGACGTAATVGSVHQALRPRGAEALAPRGEERNRNGLWRPTTPQDTFEVLAVGSLPEHMQAPFMFEKAVARCLRAIPEVVVDGLCR